MLQVKGSTIAAASRFDAGRIVMMGKENMANGRSAPWLTLAMNSVIWAAGLPTNITNTTTLPGGAKIRLASEVTDNLAVLQALVAKVGRHVTSNAVAAWL